MFDSSLQSAAVRPLILAILSRQKESYGYAIIQHVRDMSDGDMEWKDGMLYPVLQRMEKEGLIASDWRIADNGRPRKYYSITREGAAALDTAREQWRRMHGLLTHAWKPA